MSHETNSATETDFSSAMYYELLKKFIESHPQLLKPYEEFEFPQDKVDGASTNTNSPPSTFMSPGLSEAVAIFNPVFAKNEDLKISKRAGERRKGAKNYKQLSNKKLHKCYPQRFREEIIREVKVHGDRIVANKHNLPIKTVKRWYRKGLSTGVHGRKIQDPEMEAQLLTWYKNEVENKRVVTSKDIKAKAKEFSSCEVFTASKGWLEKFRNRHSLKLTRAKRTTGKKSQNM